MKNDAITATICFVLICFSVLLGCAANYQKEAYRAYSGIESHEGELATLDVWNASEVVIDDIYKVNLGEYRTVKLIAGAHKIKWVAWFLISVFYEPSGHKEFKIISNVNLEAGHTYKILHDRTTGPGYTVYFWIEDTKTGNTVWGTKKP